MNADDLKPGRVYSAKKPRRTGSIFAPLWNDRQITWISSDRARLQYDSAGLPLGRKYPIVETEVFLEWADADITEQMPADRSWRPAR